jgi:hypothetical protein
VTRYLYAGPDGEGIEALPGGIGAAIGSEYCVHLLPGPEALARAVSASRARRTPLLLLTPYFRDAELKKAVGLLRLLPEEPGFEAVVNDWGLLLAARALFPGMRLALGRLLSGGRACPRIGVSSRLTPGGWAWHGAGIASSARAREALVKELGVSGCHVDVLPWGSPPKEGEGLRLVTHGPYAIVTVSDACPWIGGVSSSAVTSCPRPCREGTVTLREPSMGGDLVQRGKARFVRTKDPEPRAGGSTVLYDDVP